MVMLAESTVVLCSVNRISVPFVSFMYVTLGRLLSGVFVVFTNTVMLTVLLSPELRLSRNQVLFSMSGVGLLLMNIVPAGIMSFMVMFVASVPPVFVTVIV